MYDWPYEMEFTHGFSRAVDFASKDRPIRNFTTAVASPERRMTMNKRIRVPQNTSFNHVRQPDKSNKPCFASLSVMHTGV
jgi:hypothetical protein